MSWKFGPIEYTRVQSPDGNIVPMHKFRIIQAPHDLVTLANDLTPEGLETALLQTTLKEPEYATYLATFFHDLLKANVKLFSKSYTSVQCIRSTKHTFKLITKEVDTSAEYYTCILTPVELQLTGGKFVMLWAVEITTIDLEIQDKSDNEDEPATVVTDVTAATAAAVAAVAAVITPVNVINEFIPDTITTPQNTVEPDDNIVNLDDIESADESWATVPVVPLRSGLPDRQLKDRRRVEEFRLRATLAAVKAKRVLEQYIDKYGDYDLESSDSYETDTDYTTDADN